MHQERSERHVRADRASPLDEEHQRGQAPPGPASCIGRAWARRPTGASFPRMAPLSHSPAGESDPHVTGVPHELGLQALARARPRSPFAWRLELGGAASRVGPGPPGLTSRSRSAGAPMRTEWPRADWAPWQALPPEGAVWRRHTRQATASRHQLQPASNTSDIAIAFACRRQRKWCWSSDAGA
jgi:hypothetical protein